MNVVYGLASWVLFVIVYTVFNCVYFVCLFFCHCFYSFQCSSPFCRVNPLYVAHTIFKLVSCYINAVIVYTSVLPPDNVRRF